MKKRLIGMLLCITIIFSVLNMPYNVSAAGDGIITIDTVKALTGDTVMVNLSISDNPGIMAMTITVNYDKDAVEYEDYFIGVLRDYTVADHDGYLRLVSCDSRNNRSNGKMISLQFKVKDNASYDFHPITITYSAGDFCDWNLTRLMPEIVSGGVDVGYNGNNCQHTYNDWVVSAEPSCTKAGVKQHSCSKCGHNEIQKTDATGHDYSKDWEVDSIADDTSDGSMSRHCKKCDSKKDIVNFTVSDAIESGFSNTVGAIVKAGTFSKAVATPDEDKAESNENPADNTGDGEAGTDTKQPPADTEQNASDIITSVKNDDYKNKYQAVISGVYTYLFGNEEDIGIIKLIKNALPDKIETGIKVALVLTAVSYLII